MGKKQLGGQKTKAKGPSQPKMKVRPQTGNSSGLKKAERRRIRAELDEKLGFESSLVKPVTVTKPFDSTEAILVAQIVTADILRKDPYLFTQPVAGISNNAVTTPVGFCAYLMLYLFAKMMELNLVAGAPASMAGCFDKTFKVPMAWAKWVQYYLQHKTKYLHFTTKYKYSNDYNLTQSSFAATNVVLYDNLSETDLTMFGGIVADFPNVQINPWQAVDSTNDDVQRIAPALPYSGLFSGPKPFCAALEELTAINQHLSSRPYSVAYQDVGLNAPDASAWAIPYGPQGAGGWTAAGSSTGIPFTAITNSLPYVPELVMVLRPNFTGTGQVNFGSQLGITKCAPMPTATHCPASGAAAVTLATDTTAVAEYLQKFVWLLNNQCEYPKGHFYGKNGCKIAGIPVPSMTEWVTQNIDFYGIANVALQYLVQFGNTAAGVPNTLSTDVICNYKWLIDLLIVNRCQTVGSPHFLTGLEPQPSLAPQSLWAPPTMGISVDPVLVNLVQCIGPVFTRRGKSHQLTIPVLSPNCFGTLADGNTINYANWSKFGTAAGPAAQYPNGPQPLFKQDTNSIAGFSNAPFFCGFQKFPSWAAGSGKFPGLFQGAGTAASATGVYIGQVTPTGPLFTNQTGAVPVGGATPFSVFWFAHVQNIADGIVGYFQQGQINMRNLTSRVAGVLGGPQMLGHVIKIPVADTPGDSGYVAAQVYFDNATLQVISQAVGVNDPWFEYAVRSQVPLTTYDAALSVGMPLIATYVPSGNTSQNVGRGELFEYKPTNGRMGVVRNQWLDNFLQIEGPLQIAYTEERLKHGRGGYNRNCWIEPLLKVGDAIGGAISSDVFSAGVDAALSPIISPIGATIVSEAFSVLGRGITFLTQDIRKKGPNPAKKKL